mmetsp:Transcript_5209/g.14025  ORF Transcript_5209/g.14025 Transcript_5209/m.14025 type:complete len:81 (+) Transcript_5209:1131-1373(+)
MLECAMCTSTLHAIKDGIVAEYSSQSFNCSAQVLVAGMAGLCSFLELRARVCMHACMLLVDRTVLPPPVQASGYGIVPSM